MNKNWNDSLVEVLNSLTKSNPKKIYIIGSKLSDIIYLKFYKKNVKIKNFDQLLTIMENVILKCKPQLADIVNSVKEEDIPIELNEDIDVVNKQRWINFKKLCKLCKKKKVEPIYI